MIVLKKKKILLSLCFTKGKFPLKENSRNFIFKNVVRITERMMDEARHSLIHFTERATTSTSLKSSWNNPNSYHMAVLETFPPHAKGEINANDAQINFPPLSKLWRRRIPRQQGLGIKFAGIRNRRRRIFSREQFSHVCYAVMLTSLLTRFSREKSRKQRAYCTITRITV